MPAEPRPSTSLCVALALLALLPGGCVAAAVPVLAGSAIVKQQTDGDGKKEDGDHPERIAIDLDSAVQPALVAGKAPVPQAAPEAKAPLAEVPVATQPKAQAVTPPETKPVPPASRAEAKVKKAPPAAAAVATPPRMSAPPGANDPFSAFVGFALGKAPPPPPGIVRRSALVDQDSLFDKPRLADCAEAPPAVVIDLDPGTTTFDPADPPLPAPGLAERLAELRRGGITVLWAAGVTVDQAPAVYTVLRATGLDPDRTDRLLLPRNPDERKQTRRLAAGRDWCIVAIAGDRRGDFDELFDYLREPDGPIATALAPELGNGWFLVPTPIE